MFNVEQNNLDFFLSYLNKEIREKRITPEKMKDYKVLSVGTGQRTKDGMNRWCYIVSISSKPNAYRAEIELEIPMYKEYD